MPRVRLGPSMLGEEYIATPIILSKSWHLGKLQVKSPSPHHVTRLEYVVSVDLPSKQGVLGH